MKSTRVSFNRRLPTLITVNIDWTDKTIEITKTAEEPVVSKWDACRRSGSDSEGR